MDSSSSQTAQQPLPSHRLDAPGREPGADAVHLSDLPPGALEKLPPSRKLMLAREIVATYARVRWWLARRDITEAVAGLRGGAPEAPGAEYSPAVHVNAARLGWAVRRTLRFVPTDSRCLMQSLVLTTLLSARQIESSVVIGVSPEPSFEAHAWVEYCGRPLLPDDQDVFERLTTV